MAPAGVRDLVQDGDVEPNPGPSVEDTVFGINVNGPAGMWSILRTLKSEADVILCQETVFPSVPAAKALETSACENGFRFYGQPGPVGHRGVGILINKALRCRWLHSWVHDDAQAVAVLVEGVIFVSMRVSCQGQAPELQAEVLESLCNRFDYVPWFIFGDFNEFPNPNVFLAAFRNSGPMAGNSQEEIDAAWLDFGQALQEVAARIATQSVSRPADMAPAARKRGESQEQNRKSGNSQEEIDAAWLDFGQALQEVFDTAAEFSNWFEQTGKVSVMWTFARQVHLPKHVPRPDGRCDASELRPITLLS
eukprot:s422_g10.t1